MTLLEASLHYLQHGLSVFPCRMVTPGDIEAERSCATEESIDIEDADERREFIDRKVKEFIRSNAKKPLVSWKPYQHRLATEEEVRQWFTYCDPYRTAIGIVTGKISGIVVVDCDTEEAWAYAKANFPPAPTVKSGRGYHLYYRYLEGLRNFQSKSALVGIDFRADGGFIIAPPSPHYMGGRYEWI